MKQTRRLFLALRIGGLVCALTFGMVVCVHEFFAYRELSTVQPTIILAPSEAVPIKPNQSAKYPFSLTSGQTASVLIKGDGKLQVDMRDSANNHVAIPRPDAENIGNNLIPSPVTPVTFADQDVMFLFAPSRPGDFNLTITNVDDKDISITAAVTH